MTTQTTFLTQTAQPIAPAVADRLVRAAEALEREIEREWGALDAGFVSDRLREVLAVLRTHGHRRADGSRRTAAEQAEFAEALLRRYCHGTGRTRAARAARRPRPLSAEELSEAGWEPADPRDDFHAWLDREDDLDRRRAVLAALHAHGCPRERACALVWRLFDGLEWDEIARRLDERFEVALDPAALRQWAHRTLKRHGPALLDELRCRAEPGPGPDVTPGRSRGMVTVDRAPTRRARKEVRRMEA